jgi:dipeptidyl-peptidase-4
MHVPKKICLSFFFALLFALSSLVLPQQKKPQEITLEDMFNKQTFDPHPISARSMEDGEHYTVLEEGHTFVKYSYRTGDKVETLLDISQTELERISDYAFSQNEAEILLTTAATRYFPRGQIAQCYVWDNQTNVIKPVSRNGKQRLATLSPDGTKVAFVRDNNLLIKDLVTNTEDQITTDGETNAIINGAADYVYYEFDLASGFTWSPDSAKIAYYRFDEREVPLVNMAMFFGLYPDNYTYKFPKPGEKNAVVQIFVYNLKTQSARRMDIGEDKDQYIPRVKWTRDSKNLCITRLNRHQNRLELLFADPQTGQSRVFFEETNTSWIDIHDDLTFLPGDGQFLWTSERDGFNHIYLFNTKGKLIRQITQGQWDVRAFHGYDPKTQTIYYTASESSPLQTDVFAINIDGRAKRKLTSLPGHHRASFSKTHKYFIDTHSDANTPPTISIHGSDGKRLHTLEDNFKVRIAMGTYGFTKKEFFTLTTSEGITLHAWMIKPPDFDPGKKYPVLMYVYGGPGSQTVTDSWDSNFAWYQMFAQKGIIVVSVDGRGSGARGQEFKKATYLNIGRYETQDQIEGAKYLSTLPYVNGSRIGIYGGSYGGYMAALCILKGADIFKLAVSSKPVTHWKYYDTIYTERYMRTPEENPGGYGESAPITHVEKLKGKLLLLHGTADDNVHFQHSMMFAEALVEANKQFDMHFYTNKNHGYNHSREGNTRLHLHTKITNFILENL